LGNDFPISLEALKICSKCEKVLPRSEFSPSSGGVYLRAECKSCARNLAGIRKQLREKHGQPPIGYTCPICLKKEKDLKGKGGNAGIWVVDHDHVTDIFRGHVCHNCNRGLGVFEDSVERFQRAIEYLLLAR
jgi:hypothetical protein